MVLRRILRNSSYYCRLPIARSRGLIGKVPQYLRVVAFVNARFFNVSARGLFVTARQGSARFRLASSFIPWWHIVILSRFIVDPSLSIVTVVWSGVARPHLVLLYALISLILGHIRFCLKTTLFEVGPWSILLVGALVCSLPWNIPWCWSACISPNTSMIFLFWLKRVADAPCRSLLETGVSLSLWTAHLCSTFCCRFALYWGRDHFYYSLEHFAAWSTFCTECCDGHSQIHWHRHIFYPPFYKLWFRLSQLFSCSNYFLLNHAPFHSEIRSPFCDCIHYALHHVPILWLPFHIVNRF